ncbi:hypothetical protein ACFU99_29090, partial [Streptomyces sp. NPDC057654]
MTPARPLPAATAHDRPPAQPENGRTRPHPAPTPPEPTGPAAARTTPTPAGATSAGETEHQVTRAHD